MAERRASYDDALQAADALKALQGNIGELLAMMEMRHASLTYCQLKTVRDQVIKYRHTIRAMTEGMRPR